jgi:hypothetical protein
MVVGGHSDLASEISAGGGGGEVAATEIAGVGAAAEIAGTGWWGKRTRRQNMPVHAYTTNL